MKSDKNTVRIIGGKWRSRKIHFAEIDGLRPTHDRVRETLFNWLAPAIDDATCLDLFAGSGALGFEALSRGAKSVYFVDDDQTVERMLSENTQRLSAQSQVTVLKERCPGGKLNNRLQGLQFDIAFLDPPYRQGLLQSMLEWLVGSHLLKPNAKIYVEYEKGLSLELPSDCKMIKYRETRSLCYGLIE